MSANLATVPQMELLRRAIRTILVEASIWDEDAVLIERQTNTWNDIAIAMAAAAHGSILVVGIAEGNPTEQDGLEEELTVVATLLAKNTLTPDQVPEELLWEKTVRVLHNAVPSYPGGVDHWHYRLRYQGFRDAPELLDEHEEIAQLARQGTFKVKFSLQPDH